jgi:hypothetical protein
VFNVFSETLNLSVNGQSAGTINDWTGPAGGAKYQPNSLAVPRVLNPSDGMGQFYQGGGPDGKGNQVEVHWLEQPTTFNLLLDPHQHPLPQDLLLFITGTSWSLVTEDGAEADHGTF